MKTLYVDMSINTQRYLARFLKLFPQLEMYPRTPIITLTYTGSEQEYTERILNLKWCFAKGTFRVVLLAQELGASEAEKTRKELADMIANKNSNEGTIDEKLHWLYNLNKTNVEAAAPNFAQGVKSLYKQLTVESALIIFLDGEDRKYRPFKLFEYKKRAHTFEQLY